MTASRILVGMSEIHVSKGPANFVCLGLGSCIGLAMHDPKNGVSGMIHIVLPESFAGQPVDKVGKFANTGIPALLEQMLAAGAEQRYIRVSFAGGAQVFKFGNGEGRLDVGKRNGAAVEEITRNLRLIVKAADIGGTQGRTVTFDTETGELKVRHATGGERTLCNLNAA